MSLVKPVFLCSGISLLECRQLGMICTACINTFISVHLWPYTGVKFVSTQLVLSPPQFVMRQLSSCIVTCVSLYRYTVSSQWYLLTVCCTFEFDCSYNTEYVRTIQSWLLVGHRGGTRFIEARAVSSECLVCVCYIGWCCSVLMSLPVSVRFH